MDKIYITGIAGFLGSHLAEYFVKQGHQVSGCDSLIGGDPDNLNGLDVKWRKLDICDFHEHSEQLKGVDLVYHCAAQAHEGASVFAPAAISRSIYSGTASVVSAVIQAGVGRLVNCSSMARYGALQPPFVESRQCQPIDPYGIAKRAAEDLIRNMAVVHGFEYVIAVPHNIYGPRQCYTDGMRNVASIMVNMLLQNRPPLIYGDGSQTRCFSYIDDCIGPLVKMATQRNVVGEVINIGPDSGTISINGLCDLLIELTHKPHLKPTHIDPRPQEVKHAMCSADKARQLLDYEAKTSLREGMQKLVDWISLKGPKRFNYPVELEIINAATPKPWTYRLF